MNNDLSDFISLAEQFESRFNTNHFPAQPEKLYYAAQHLLTLKGKRVRPVLCLMANELFGPIGEDAYYAACAIELFHNFTLVHDDIMDHAPIRRGQPTVHEKYGTSTAILAGDVMLVQAYEYLNKIGIGYLPKVLSLFSYTARKVCEGQQLDMEFEEVEKVSLEDYVEMIGLKTSVLLAASLQMGSLLGGAGQANQEYLYDFGKNLGIAFQVQDDYLDAFGDPEKFGKKTGGDILSNKKTFLLLRAREVADNNQRSALESWSNVKDESKIQPILEIYKSCGVDEWARELKSIYLNNALASLEEAAVLSKRKLPLEKLAHQLLDREQ